MKVQRQHFIADACQLAGVELHPFGPGVFVVNDQDGRQLFLDIGPGPKAGHRTDRAGKTHVFGNERRLCVRQKIIQKRRQDACVVFAVPLEFVQERRYSAGLRCRLLDAADRGRQGEAEHANPPASPARKNVHDRSWC